MAIARRLSGVEKFYISLSWDTVFSSEHGVGISIGVTSTAWRLEQVEAFADGLLVTDVRLQLEQMLMNVGNEQPFIRIYDKASGNSLHDEPLLFHHSFFLPFFDFARTERFPPYMGPSFERPEFLAVFTHVYNEDEMLTMWERHYSQMTPHRHLYVIDHGSTTSPRQMLTGATNVVHIPRGGVDHANIAGFCNYFQRFLLTQYKWVIHVDCDEFLIYETGIPAFLTMLGATRPGVIIRPKHAYEVIHDYNLEPTLACSHPVSAQRRMLRTAVHYRKPALTSVPTTWTMGFHQAFEEHLIAEEEQLWLIHLAFADLDRNLGRQMKWKTLPKSEATAALVPETETERAENLVELRHKFDGMLQDDGIEVPQWMRGMF